MRPEAKHKPIDVAAARATFEYRGGALYWKVAKGPRTKIGMRAGSKNKRGYRYVTSGDLVCLEHRLVYAIVHGVDPACMLVDHINGDRGDNRVENLRLATNQQNVAHQKTAASNNRSTGVRGVYPKLKKFRASVTYSGKELYLGTYGTIEQAAEVVRAKRAELFGEFAGGG